MEMKITAWMALVVLVIVGLCVYPVNAWITNEGTKQLTSSSLGQSQPIWNLDGTKIVYETSRWDPFDLDIWVMDADGTNKIQLTTDSTIQTSASWSPDGTKIVYRSGQPGGNYDIWVMNADGSNKVQLTNDTNIQYHPSWIPKGEKIIYETLRETENHGDIWIMNADGTGKTWLASGTGVGAPSYSVSDTGKIVYDKYEGNNNWDIWIMELDGSNKRQLTTALSINREPLISPDGNEIAYGKSEESYMHGDIWVMDSDGSNKKRLSTGWVRVGYASWSPDSTKLAFFDGTPYQIFVINADGTGKTQLTAGATYNHDPSWSPDGTKIAYASAKSTDESGESNIWVMSLGGVTSPATTAPVITPVPTSTLTPTPSASTPPLYLIGAVVIAIIIIAGVGIARIGKGGNSGPTIPQPPAEPPKPKTEPTPQKPTIEPVYIKEPRIDVTSAFGYKGATILYKIKVNNSTPEPISDIRVSLFVPDVFLLKEKEKSIVMLEPHESNTVTFTIRPTGECGDCNVSGKVNYYDYSTKKRQEVDIHAKSLSIVCPMLKAKQIDKAAWKDTVSRLIKAEESTKEIQIPAETLFNMASRVVDDMNMFSLEPEVTSTPQLFNGVARFYSEGVKELKYAAQIEVVGGAKKSKLILKVWAEKEEALTGFYHGILDEIEKRVQVKGYIEDSIVQQFYHIGDRIGSVVKDSVVQRSTIGRVKNCPSCKRDVSEDEWFCPHCGAELK